MREGPKGEERIHMRREHLRRGMTTCLRGVSRSDGGARWWAKEWRRTMRVMVANDADGWWGWKAARPVTVVRDKSVVHLRSVGRARKVDSTRIPERLHRENRKNPPRRTMAPLLARYRREIKREYGDTSDRDERHLSPWRIEGIRLTDWSPSTNSASHFRKRGGKIARLYAIERKGSPLSGKSRV